MATESKGSGAKLARLAMRTRSVNEVTRPYVKKGPRRHLLGKVKAGLSGRRARDYAARIAAALPACIEAPPGETHWRSALVGPARYPHGYRDVVILSAGRLLPAVVRQNGRGGNLRKDAAKEISRVVKGRPHRDRLLRPLVTPVVVNAAWLREAARRHDVPLNPSLASALLDEVRRCGATEKAAFRATLDPEVVKLLTADGDLERFHDWLSDHRIQPAVRTRRRAAFAAIRAGCDHIRSREAFAARLDAGEDAFTLLGEILDASPKALRKLARRRNDPLAGLEDAQRKAWALELMPQEILAEIDGDLAGAGAWAGRAMSFGRIVSDDPMDRRSAARRLLERRGLSRFVDYPKTFNDWPFEEGQRELREMLQAVVRFGLLPAIIDEADQGRRAAPTEADVAVSVREFARVVSNSVGIMTVEIARFEWRKVAPWLAKNLIAVSHSSLSAWPPLIAPFKGVAAEIDCLASREALEEENGRLGWNPNALYDVLVEGAHILRLRDAEDTTIALGVINQAELEAARKRGRVDGGDIDREGWAAKAQWKRLMRVESARIINRVARAQDEPRCDLADLRLKLDERAREAASIAARPCGFDHANAEARQLALMALEGLMKQIVRNPLRLAHHLFGPPQNAGLEADAAFLKGTPMPDSLPQGAAQQPVRPADKPVSALLLPPSPHELAAPAEYNPSAATGRIRRSIIKGNPAVPKDPLTARFVVLDVETTGLNARDRIVEIAAIELIGAKATGESFHSLIKTDLVVSDGALAVHGITQEMLKNQPTFAKIADRLVEFLARPGSWLVAHHAEFDVGFINRELERAGRKFRFPTNRAICTLQMTGSSLDLACDRLGIDRKSRTKHRAQLDAELCAEVFRRLVFGGATTAESHEGNKSG